MKNIFLIPVLLIVNGLHAQQDSIVRTELYFEFYTSGTFNDPNPDRIKINRGLSNFGNDSMQMLVKNHIYSCADAGEVLEYLNTLGWELASAYATSYGYASKRYYLMKRKVK